MTSETEPEWTPGAELAALEPQHDAPASELEPAVDPDSVKLLPRKRKGPAQGTASPHVEKPQF